MHAAISSPAVSGRGATHGDDKAGIPGTSPAIDRPMRRFVQLSLLTAAAIASIATSMVVPGMYDVTPHDGETAVHPDIQPALTFDGEFDVDEGDVLLVDAVSGDVVPGTLRIGTFEGVFTIRFMPTDSLIESDYELRLGDSVLPYATQPVYTFSTYSDPRVRTAAFIDGNRTIIHVSFSEDMDPTSLTADTVALFAGDVRVDAALTWMEDDWHTLRLILPSPQPAGFALRLTLSPGIRSAIGTEMAALPLDLTIN
jgi:hypothetical protein